MSAVYKLTAIPSLLPEGEDKGHLETVTFIAESSSDSHKWWSVNNGCYEQDFAAIVQPDEAKSFVRMLRAGETVHFPGFYELDRVLHKFGGSYND